MKLTREGVVLQDDLMNNAASWFPETDFVLGGVKFKRKILSGVLGEIKSGIRSMLMRLRVQSSSGDLDSTSSTHVAHSKSIWNKIEL